MTAAFNVNAYLRDIDQEIMHHRQEIARRQVAIVQLEDMRVLMMQREETRAAMNGQPSPFGTLPGADIVVRQKKLAQTREDSDAKAIAAPPQLPLNKVGNRRGLHPKRKGSVHNRYKIEVMQLLKKNPQSEFNVDAIIAKLGLGPLQGKQRQPLYQALYELRKNKIIFSPSGPGSYQIAR